MQPNSSLDKYSQWILLAVLLLVSAAWADSVRGFCRLSSLLILGFLGMVLWRPPVSLFWVLWNGSLYIVIGAGTFFTSNFKVDFSAEQKVLFYGGLLVNVANSLRSFTDGSLSKFLGISEGDGKTGKPEIPGSSGGGAISQQATST